MKYVKVLIPASLIMVFVFVMNTAFIFHPFVKSIPDLFNDIENSIVNEDWDKASEKTDALYKELKEKFLWMQFAIERKEMNSLIVNLYKLKGCIKIEDVSGSIDSLYEMRANWSHLGS
ncbi:MAG: DUF4363 family protein [Clostridiaceae bacterium]|nr:DUF4363 family protein [Clostridiaceae bacterium]